jgi:hypothetical protein
MGKNKCLKSLLINDRMDFKKPLKSKRLKVIDYIGTLYATFNGSSMWKIDKVAFEILKMCNGRKTVEEIVKEVSEKTRLKKDEVKPVVEDILNELERKKFIEWA